LGEGREISHIKLPSFNMLSGILACDNNHELGDLTPNHPVVYLAHDFLNIGFDLVIGGYKHGETILLYSAKRYELDVSTGGRVFCTLKNPRRGRHLFGS
jgi:hypothetical protein